MIIFVSGLGSLLKYMDNQNYTTPLFAGDKSRTEHPYICGFPTPATKEFCYSPPMLIISSMNKSKAG